MNELYHDTPIMNIKEIRDKALQWKNYLYKYKVLIN